MGASPCRCHCCPCPCRLQLPYATGSRSNSPGSQPPYHGLPAQEQRGVEGEDDGGLMEWWRRTEGRILAAHGGAMGIGRSGRPERSSAEGPWGGAGGQRRPRSGAVTKKSCERTMMTRTSFMCKWDGKQGIGWGRKLATKRAIWRL